MLRLVESYRVALTVSLSIFFISSAQGDFEKYVPSGDYLETVGVSTLTSLDAERVRLTLAPGSIIRILKSPEGSSCCELYDGDRMRRFSLPPHTATINLKPLRDIALTIANTREGMLRENALICMSRLMLKNDAQDFCAPILSSLREHFTTVADETKIKCLSSLPTNLSQSELTLWEDLIRAIVRKTTNNTLIRAGFRFFGSYATAHESIAMLVDRLTDPVLGDASLIALVDIATRDAACARDICEMAVKRFMVDSNAGNAAVYGELLFSLPSLASERLEKADLEALFSSSDPMKRMCLCYFSTHLNLTSEGMLTKLRQRLLCESDITPVTVVESLFLAFHSHQECDRLLLLQQCECLPDFQRYSVISELGAFESSLSFSSEARSRFAMLNSSVIEHCWRQGTAAGRETALFALVKLAPLNRTKGIEELLLEGLYDPDSKIVRACGSVIARDFFTLTPESRRKVQERLTELNCENHNQDLVDAFAELIVRSWPLPRASQYLKYVSNSMKIRIARNSLEDTRLRLVLATDESDAVRWTALSEGVFHDRLRKGNDFEREHRLKAIILDDASPVVKADLPRLLMSSGFCKETCPHCDHLLRRMFESDNEELRALAYSEILQRDKTLKRLYEGLNDESAQVRNVALEFLRFRGGRILGDERIFINELTRNISSSKPEITEALAQLVTLSKPTFDVVFAQLVSNFENKEKWSVGGDTWDKLLILHADRGNRRRELLEMYHRHGLVGSGFDLMPWLLEQLRTSQDAEVVDWILQIFIQMFETGEEAAGGDFDIWPPPAGTFTCTLANELTKGTLGDVYKRIKAALVSAGYGDCVAFDGRASGFAVVTRIEAFDKDGAFLESEEKRYNLRARRRSLNLLDYWYELWGVESGEFRVFLLAITNEPIDGLPTYTIDALANVDGTYPDELGGAHAQINASGYKAYALVYVIAWDAAGKFRLVKKTEHGLTSDQHLRRIMMYLLTNEK